MSSKRSGKYKWLKNNQFQKGNIPHNKGLQCNTEDSNNASFSPPVLRSEKTRNNDLEVNSNRCLNLKLTQDLFHDAMTEHRALTSECRGKLEWDMSAEQQWGLGWKERLKCNTCPYLSRLTPLYQEIYTHKRGRRAAAINKGLQIGMKTTGISNQGMRNILLAANIPPPSAASMQVQANQVGEAIVELNEQSMANIREDLHKKTAGAPIRIEGDARYNNPLFSGGGKTPFQPATQVTYTVCENTTPEKKVIAIFTGNKLCKVAQLERNRGRAVKCPHHAGTCTADLEEDSAIGDERAWVKKCTQQLQQSKLTVSHFTGDGDSKAFEGVKEMQKSTVDRLYDLRHLANAQKRFVQKIQFTASVLPATQMKEKRRQLQLLAQDLSSRCIAELKEAHKYHKGDMMQIQRHMPKAVQAIMKCYESCESSTCDEGSYICKPGLKKPWKKLFLPVGFYLDLSSSSDRANLESAINMILGETALKITKYLTTTQKSEAMNRAYLRSNPKSITWSRNFRSRIHTAVHMQNVGLVQSTMEKCKKVGAPILRNTRVALALKNEERRSTYLALRKKLDKYKQRRCYLRTRKYLLHRVKDRETYRTGLTDPYVKHDHDYAKHDRL